MNCQHCGVALTPESRFCANCGAATSPTTSFPGVPSYPPPPATGPEGIGLPSPPGVVGDCIRIGWAVFQREGLILVGMYLVYTILTSGPGLTLNHFFGEDHPFNLTIKFGTAALSMFLYPGFIVAGLKAVRGGKVEFTDLFAGFSRLGAVLAWGVLGGIATALGMLFLVLPGIIVALGLSQAGFLVFDRGMGGLDSLKASWKLMIGYRWSFFLLMLTLIGVNILGVLALCIGFFVTAPLTAVVLAVIYERVRQWNGGTLAEGGVLTSGGGPPGVTEG